jgi:hypothetical protein
MLWFLERGASLTGRWGVGVTEQLVDCSGGTDFTLEGGTRRKIDAMWTLLKQNAVPRTIVFCNKIETCRKLENFISRQVGKGTHMDALAYHAGLTPTARAANLSRFLRPPQPVEPRLILVCTDRCAACPAADWKITLFVGLRSLGPQLQAVAAAVAAPRALLH